MLSLTAASLAILARTTMAAGGGGGGGPEEVDTEGPVNWFLVKGLLWAWVAVVGVTMVYCAGLKAAAYLRTIACLNSNTQRYFSQPNMLHDDVKKHLLEAPLFRKRHHREFKLSSAMNMGVLPSRMQMLFLVAYIAASVTLTTVDFPWDGTKAEIMEAMVRRSGMLAIMNMIPLWLLAARNNPLIKLTGITFDTYNLVHRWLGRIVVAEAVIHTAMWMAKKVSTGGGWPAVLKSIQNSEFILSGFIGTCAFVFLFTHSPSAIRHAFYESFLVMHQLVAALSLAAVWVHLKADRYKYQHAIIKGVLAIWVIERGIRFLRLMYHNVGRGGSYAEVEALPGEACRVTVRMARPWRFRTGSHAYIYLPSIGLWTSHPFSIAWSEETNSLTSKSVTFDPEKGIEMERSEVLGKGEQSISFIIRRRTGFTDKLWRKAERSANGRFTSRCFLEGPYSSETLHSYGTVLLFAAGVGIAHQVPHARDLVTGYANGTVAARKVTLIWIIQSPEHLEWIRPWMTTILSLPRRREVLKILLFITRPRSTKEIHSPSSSVQMFPGKPNIQALVDQEVEQAIGTVGVSVCGVGALADDVRKSCRSWMGKVNLDFAEESFSW